MRVDTEGVLLDGDEVGAARGHVGQGLFEREEVGERFRDRDDTVLSHGDEVVLSAMQL